MDKQDTTRVNRDIKAKEVRVIDPEGQQLGIMPTYRALAIAGDFGFDLVEVSPNTEPPVCKIMDYGKFKYELTKKKVEAKKNQVTHDLKEVKVRLVTSEHDLQTKLKQVRKFIARKDKVKISLMFRGREISMKNVAFELFNRIINEVEDSVIVEHKPKLEGRFISMTLGPK